MKNSEEDFSKVTRVARLTPAMPAAIATIAVWGPQSVDAVEKHLRSPRGDTVILKSGAVRYGLWNPSTEMAAEQVVVCLTDVDCVEIHCHGGNAVCEMIFRDLIASGCVRTESQLLPTAEQSEIEREAADDLILATTDRAAAILIDQLNGALEGAIAELSERKLREGRDSIKEHVRELLDWSELGLHLSKPWQVVLAGPPNTGKSSLMNAILGAQRSIVHHEPGTTRDWVEGLTAIDGWPVAISDTAGVRESRDQIESEGVRRSMRRVQEADLVVMVVDSTVGGPRRMMKFSRLQRANAC